MRVYCDRGTYICRYIHTCIHVYTCRKRCVELGIEGDGEARCSMQYMYVWNDESVQVEDGAGPHIRQKSVIEGESAYVVMSDHC